LMTGEQANFVLHDRCVHYRQLPCHTLPAAELKMVNRSAEKNGRVRLSC
jgi:hypothetical protein